MQVSNSTGRNTDYRIGASGGSGTSSAGAYASSTTQVTTAPADLASGQLAPGDSQICDGCDGCSVEFMIDGSVVASAYYFGDPGAVALVEQDGQYKILTASDGDAVA